MQAILGGLLIFVLRLSDVTPGTSRVLTTVRDRKRLAAMIGAVGEGTPVILLGEQVYFGGRLWAHVLAAGTPSGWIALDYLEVLIR